MLIRGYETISPKSFAETRTWVYLCGQQVSVNKSSCVAAYGALAEFRWLPTDFMLLRKLRIFGDNSSAERPTRVQRCTSSQIPLPYNCTTNRAERKRDATPYLRRNKKDYDHATSLVVVQTYSAGRKEVTQETLLRSCRDSRPSLGMHHRHTKWLHPCWCGIPVSNSTLL